MVKHIFSIIISVAFQGLHQSVFLQPTAILSNKCAIMRIEKKTGYGKMGLKLREKEGEQRAGGGKAGIHSV
ncbi:MAG: hypothetical protein IJ157_14960 [Clostridia bacterium]|nr:hypothetical protein [Clostridia bacterium]